MRYASRVLLHLPVYSNISKIGNKSTLDRDGREYNRYLVRLLLYDVTKSRMLASLCANGSPDGFWSYESASLTLSCAPICVRIVHSDPSSLFSLLVPHDSCSALELDTATRTRNRQSMLSYCQEHPDVALTVHASGARTSANILQH